MAQTNAVIEEVTGTHGFAVAATNNSNLRAIAYDGTDGTRIVGSNTLSITVVNGGSNTSIRNLEVNFIVGEISFNTGTDGKDVFKLYNATDDGDLSIDDLTLIDTIEANVDESTLSKLNLSRQVNVNYDEIRIGTTLGSVVVAIPELNGCPSHFSPALPGRWECGRSRRRFLLKIAFAIAATNFKAWMSRA